MDRTVLVLSSEVIKNSYGEKLTFTDEHGDKFSIGEKRKDFWPVILDNPNRMVKLVFKTFTKDGKSVDYIDSAFLADVPERKATTGTGQPKPTVPSADLIRNRCMILAYTKDMVNAGKVELKDMEATADRMMTWLMK